MTNYDSCIAEATKQGINVIGNKIADTTPAGDSPAVN